MREKGKNVVRTTRANRTGQPPPLPLPDYSFVGLAAHQMSSVRSNMSCVTSALSWKIARYVPSPYAIRNTHLSRSVRRQTCTNAIISSLPPPRLACIQLSLGVSAHESSTLRNFSRPECVGKPKTRVSLINEQAAPRFSSQGSSFLTHLPCLRVG